MSENEIVSQTFQEFVSGTSSRLLVENFEGSTYNTIVEEVVDGKVVSSRVEEVEEKVN